MSSPQTLKTNIDVKQDNSLVQTNQYIASLNAIFVEYKTTLLQYINYDKTFSKRIYNINMTNTKFQFENGCV